MKVDLFSIGPFTVHGYGLMIGIGVLCCIFMGMRRAGKYKMREEAVIDIALFGLLAGLSEQSFSIFLWSSRPSLRIP